MKNKLATRAEYNTGESILYMAMAISDKLLRNAILD